jgi:prepilin-type N-terminal cleavage/methylation domain-containing protein
MKRQVHPRGFSLVEALVALSIVTIAGAALLVQVGGESRFSVESVDYTVAQGIAQQLMDEIAGCKYVSDSQAPTSNVFGPTAWELAGVGRQRYDDIDDYDGYTASPPVDRYGVALGTNDAFGNMRHAQFRTAAGAFTGWRETVNVYYVSNADPSVRMAAGAPSNYRAVEVIITYTDAVEGAVELARLRRLFCYVPTPT